MMARFSIGSLMTMAVIAMFAATSQAALVGFYDFEGDALDSSGMSNDGTINGSVPFVGSGFEGQAAQFVGNTANSIDVPINLNPGVAPQATFGAWVNADVINAPAARHEIISTDNGGFDRALSIDSRIGGGETGVARYGAFNGGAGVLPGAPASTADGYIFVAARYNQTTQQTSLFVDGQKFVAAGNPGGSQTFTRIGTHPFANEPFNGRIDNVFVFDEALTDAQVAHIAENGSAGVFSVPTQQSNMLWSVDIGGVGGTALGQSDPHLLFTGLEGNYGYGDVWNRFDVPGHPTPAATSLSMPLVDSAGDFSPVSLTIDRILSPGDDPTDGIVGWGGTVPPGGFNNLVRDYMFVGTGIGNAASTAAWKLDGLDPKGIYEIYAYGGNSRDVRFTVDQLGVSALVGGTGLLFAEIRPDALGQITGLVAGGTVSEGNWGGFQLRKSGQIPEPTSAVLVGLGVIAAMRRRRMLAA